jgi:GT2 family glycosyltransferase
VVAATPAVSISVLIVTARRQQLLDRCLDALSKAGGGVDLEVIVGCRDDESTSAALRRSRRDVSVLDLPAIPLGAARNLLTPYCSGDLVVFLDDDTTPGPDFLRHLVTLAESHPDVDIFGGPNLTGAPTSPFVRAQDAVLQSRHVGPVRHRFRPGSTSTWALCLCNLAIRRRVLPQFDPTLTAGEETELLRRLAHAGCASVSDGRLAVVHQRRETIASFARQMYKYGDGRGQATPIAAAAILTVGTISIATTRSRRIWRLGSLGYAASIAASALHVSRTSRDARQGCWVAALIPLTHLTYAAGVLRGATSALLQRRAGRP